MYSDSHSRLYTVAELQEKMAEQQEYHKNAMNALHYELTLALVEHQDTAYKLVQKELHLYDLRKLVLRLSERLLARERHISSVSFEEQLAAANRLMLSVGGQLRDGIHGTVEQEHRLARLDIGSDDRSD
jgi:hypothetical protein